MHGHHSKLFEYMSQIEKRRCPPVSSKPRKLFLLNVIRNSGNRINARNVWNVELLD